MRGSEPERRPGSRVVYSTDPSFAGRCPRCGRDSRRCRSAQSLAPEKQTVRIQRERKERAGKTVTLVRDLQLAPEDLSALARHLKEACSACGTVKEGNTELQGDHRERVAAELRRPGYRAGLAGG
ncbi:MAG: stress response translation initiation inhibitor YciH [Anaerolineae bacterium]|nr:stress response translation initiation inhibitor YciH [Anaerolineae bacterium]